MTDDRLEIGNETIKRAFTTANYMYLYGCNADLTFSILIPNKKEVDYEEQKATN